MSMLVSTVKHAAAAVHRGTEAKACWAAAAAAVTSNGGGVEGAHGDNQRRSEGLKLTRLAWIRVQKQPQWPPGLVRRRLKP